MSHFTIKTSTGSASLYSDDSMKLEDEDGNVVLLNPEQVHEAWSNVGHISWTDEEKAEIMADSLFEEDETWEELVERHAVPFCWAFNDGIYMNFGDSLHIIPDEENFTDIRDRIFK